LGACWVRVCLWLETSLQMHGDRLGIAAEVELHVGPS
jgi:hypothetical protein